jgi:probable HAF family extracellular repeat protein
MASVDKMRVRRGTIATTAMKAVTTARLRTAAAVVAVAAVVLGMAPAAGASRHPGEGDTDGSPRPTTLSAGFLLDDGRFRTIEVPGSQVVTEPTGINDRGEIVGYYGDANLTQQAFRRDRRGRYETIRVPGAAITAALEINERGQIAGTYSDTGTFLREPPARPRGFVLDRGRFIRLDMPGAALTSAFSINDRGQVVGEYIDAEGRNHGFLWQRGRFRTIDVPGAEDTSVVDINDGGQIVGLYGDAGFETAHGFVLEDGAYTTFDVPDASLTVPFGINDRGQIVGAALRDGAFGGFLLRRATSRRFTAIDVPRAPATYAIDINNRGQIVGLYENPDATTPPPPEGPADQGDLPSMDTQPDRLSAP